MEGLTSAVHWWEESQLRVLVLTSLVIQFFFLCFPFFRTLALRGWFRFMMWLAYHGGDAVAIYALATLFNRHKDEGDGGVGGGSSSNTLLEVVWAPVLLIHLGGQDGVTAYNIEDNELWSRHLLTAGSQVTVAVYVFCKSWPTGGDKRLLQAAILLFIIGVVKCFVKAWAFKMASIYSLVSSKKINDGSMYNKLEKYVKDARDIAIRKLPEEDPVRKDDEAAEGSSNHPRSRLRQEREARIERIYEGSGEVSKLFVDLSSPYPHRIKIFEKFWGLSKEGAYESVRGGFATAFFNLYTKLKTGLATFLIRIYLPWAAIALFHHSHREAYNGIDVKVTYALLCCTAALETYSFSSLASATTGRASIFLGSQQVWPETVAQYSLAGYFVRKKKHSIKMGIVSFFQCKDFVDQLWCMEPCFTSARITYLVLGYLKDGWKKKIKDAATYRSFNNHSSHSGFNINRPFDECVLVWHLATDFCFFSSSFPDHKCAFADPPTGETKETLVPWWTWLMRVITVQGKRTSVANNPTTSSSSRPQCSQESADCKAVQCRQMSNYMLYLLFVNPEMLLPGSRRNLFKTTYGELKDNLRHWEWKPVSGSMRNLFKTTYGELKDNLRHWEWKPVCRSRYTPREVELQEETTVMKRLITVMENKIVTETAITVTQQNSERSSQEGSSMKSSNKEENIIDQAWELAKKLLKMDEMERWKEIQDVWVQMLCFSASRCRGYLHAKALGKGGEFLSYVWLLLFYMGMETFSERLQRELLPKPLHRRRHSTSF